jgi:hypothetical protein
MSKPKTMLALRNNGSATSPALPKSHGSRARTRLGRWHATFLRTLRRVPNITLACKAAGVSRRTCYDHRERSPEFAEAWDAALDESVDRVETTCFKLASEGEPRLIEFILKSHRPQVYRERIEAAVAGGIIFLPQKKDGAE